MDGPYRPIAGPSATKAASAAERPTARGSPSTKRTRLTASPADVATAADPGISPFLATASEWSCPQCTLVNAAHTGQCIVCDFARPTEIPQPDRSLLDHLSSTSGVATGWACLQCTLVNDVELSRCAACDAPRSNRSVPLPEQKAADEWTCIACGEAGMPNDFWSCRLCGSIKTRS